MPASEKSNRVFASTLFSCNKPMAANRGIALLVLIAGLAVCATVQIEQEEASF